jgi:hypothetical protein
MFGKSEQPHFSVFTNELVMDNKTHFPETVFCLFPAFSYLGYNFLT